MKIQVVIDITYCCGIRRRALRFFSVADVVVSDSGEISDKPLTYSIVDCSSDPMTA